jgi:hypothetical protein
MMQTIQDIFTPDFGKNNDHLGLVKGLNLQTPLLNYLEVRIGLEFPQNRETGENKWISPGRSLCRVIQVFSRRFLRMYLSGC